MWTISFYLPGKIGSLLYKAAFVDHEMYKRAVLVVWDIHGAELGFLDPKELVSIHLSKYEVESGGQDQTGLKFILCEAIAIINQERLLLVCGSIQVHKNYFYFFKLICGVCRGHPEFCETWYKL